VVVLLTCFFKVDKHWKLHYNIAMKKITDVQKDTICKHYAGGKSAPVLAKEYLVSSTTIYNILRERGIHSRSQHEAQRRLPLNENVFDTLTEVSAYWIGFLMADGCITQRPNSSPEISIHLKGTDVKHLEAFRKFLCSGHAIIKVQSSGSARFAVRSQKLADILASYGIIPNKTLHTRAINGAEDNRHFWRGVIDGDGSLGIYNTKHQLRLFGTRELLSQFSEFVQAKYPQLVNAVLPHKNIYCVAFGGVSAATVAAYLYKDINIALSRKQTIAEEMIEWLINYKPRQQIARF